MSEVPRKFHKFSDRELIGALSRAARREGLALSTTSVTLLGAQLLLETGRGGVTNNNPGNLAANPRTYGGDWYRPIWFDMNVVNAIQDEAKRKLYTAVHRKMLAKRAPEAFRSYPTLAQGMHAYLMLLQSERFQPILQAAATGDAEIFVRAIHETGYTPKDEIGKAADTIRSLAATVRGIVGEEGIVSPKAGVGQAGLGPLSSPLQGRQPLLPVLRVGDESDAVKLWQVILNRHLHDEHPESAASRLLTIDGVFGPRTRLITREYQLSASLLGDGVVGPKTWGSLWGDS